MLFCGKPLGSEKRVHVSVFQRESADKYSAQGGTTSPTCSAGQKLASPTPRTLPEHFSLCVSFPLDTLIVQTRVSLSVNTLECTRALHARNTPRSLLRALP